MPAISQCLDTVHGRAGLMTASICFFTSLLERFTALSCTVQNVSDLRPDAARLQLSHQNIGLLCRDLARCGSSVFGAEMVKHPPQDVFRQFRYAEITIRRFPQDMRTPYGSCALFHTSTPKTPETKLQKDALNERQIRIRNSLPSLPNPHKIRKKRHQWLLCSFIKSGKQLLTEHGPIS